MSNWQRITLGIAALIAWVILEGVSVTANVRFAQSIGVTDFEKFVLAAASVASDLFKAAAPLGVLYFIATKRWSAVVITGVFGVIAILFSLTAATGFVATQRFHSFYQAKSAAEDTMRKRDEIKKDEAALGWAPSSLKPVAVLEAERNAMEQDRRFRQTGECADARGANETWCRTYRELGVQITLSQELEKQTAKIEDKRDELSRTGRDYGDAQMKLYHDWLNIDEEKALRMVILLTVALIEIGSMGGLTTALGLLAPPGTVLGGVVATAFSVVTKKEKPNVPSAERLAAAVEAAPPPLDRRPSFDKPAPGTPEGGGLAEKLKPISLIDAVLRRRKDVA